jgi:3'-phosphoadenosine 5'-phosphosulfate sulfotransferase (PAPS reductase)/FAD synthetase
VFCDTGEELPETYDYLDTLEAYLGRQIKRLRARQSFEEMLKARGGFLPSAQVRWCTEYLKIKPFEEEVGTALCYNYIGIRSDERHRKGYISTKQNIMARYPFVEDGITREDVFRILDESGIGLPAYYEWRSRSGCYFCFFQQRIEWLGLLQHHKEYYMRAESFEKEDPITGERYTWSSRESLRELRQPVRQEQVRREHAQRLERLRNHKTNCSLAEVFFGETSFEGCLICHL